MAKKNYSKDIRSLEISIPVFSKETKYLSPNDIKILKIAYSLYDGYWEKLFPDDRIDPRIVDVYSFKEFVAGSEIEKLILKLIELNTFEEPYKNNKPKEQDASIPPELESMDAEYEKNKALLESEEIKFNSKNSVAKQVESAIAHYKNKKLAEANRKNRENAGEIIQDANKTFTALGSPKSETKVAALADSYIAVKEVALTYSGFSKLPPKLQNEIINSAVELNSIGVLDIDTAIQASTLQIDVSNLEEPVKNQLATIPGGFISTVYQEITSLDQKTTEYETKISENEQRIIKLQDELTSLPQTEREKLVIEINNITAENEHLSDSIENQSTRLENLIAKQTESFKEFEKSREKRLSQDPDLKDRIELANNKVALIYSNLENNGVKPHLFSPLDDADLLEKAIRHDMPGELNAHAGYHAEMAAALVNNPKTQDPDIIHHDIPIFYGKGLTPTLLAKARLFAINNPESELGKLFKSNKDLFDSASNQIRKIAASPLGKEIFKASSVFEKIAASPLGKSVKKVSDVFKKITDKFPTNIGNIVRIVQDPVGALRSWIGKKVGNYVVNKVLKSATGKAVTEATKKLASELLKKGTGKALAKLAVSVGAKLGIAATGVGAIPALIWLAVDIVLSVIKGATNTVQKIAVSIYGEKIKARDVIVVPIVGAVTAVTTFFSGIGTATVSAASSAVSTLALGTLVGFFFYITSIAVAPLISTLVQLESIPKTRSSASGCANTEGIFISQRDPEWASVFCKNCSPAGSCRIGSSGCSSASMTMILNGFGVTSNVTDVWHWQHSIGGYVYWDSNSPPRVYDGKIPYVSCGSDNFNSLKILSESGLSVTDIGSDLAEADSVLSNCGMILATGDMACGGGWCGHLLVIVAHEGNQITTMDPWMGENYIHTLDTSYKLFRMWAVVP